jgi:hypothetical protein
MLVEVLLCDDFFSIGQQTMRITVLAFAAVAALATTFSAAAPAAAQGIHVTTQSRHHAVPHHRSRTVVVHRRHDNGLHRGWSHSRGHAKKVVIIKHRNRH